MIIDREALEKARQAFAEIGVVTRSEDPMKAAITAYLTALEAKGLCIVDRSRLEEISASGDWQPEGVMVPCAAWQELSAMLAARGE